MNDKAQFQEIGTLWEGEKDGKPYRFISLGNSKGNESYRLDVSIKVVNAKGETVAILKNPNVSLLEPRKVKKDGTPINVPKNLKYKLSVKLGE